MAELALFGFALTAYGDRDVEFTHYVADGDFVFLLVRRTHLLLQVHNERVGALEVEHPFGTQAPPRRRTEEELKAVSAGIVAKLEHYGRIGEWVKSVLRHEPLEGLFDAPFADDPE